MSLPINRQMTAATNTEVLGYFKEGFKVIHESDVYLQYIVSADEL